MDTVLVVNAGSSSVKFQVFEVYSGNGLRLLMKGQIDGIGVRPKMRATGPNGELFIEETYAPESIRDVGTALNVGATWLRETQKLEPIAAGHRVVHGGPQFDRPVLIDKDVIAQLERYVSLAPLHQPNNLAAIRSISARSPEFPQVACFDTAFHRDHGALADHYAVPLSLYNQGVRRYGFHGLSYEFVAGSLSQVAPKIASGRVIVAHLGSGASMCALSAGRSVESTMGFTALDGLPMGTRAGQLDPGVVLYLLQEKQMTAAQLQQLLYEECGLKGLSGISNDVRVLEGSSDPQADFALDYFAHRVALNSGFLAAALGGLDGFVFTAGIGENSPSMRSRIVQKLALFGGILDPDANAAGVSRISSQASRIEIRVIATDEELMIARHTLALLASSSSRSASAWRATAGPQTVEPASAHDAKMVARRSRPAKGRPP